MMKSVMMEKLHQNIVKDHAMNVKKKKKKKKKNEKAILCTRNYQITYYIHDMKNSKDIQTTTRNGTKQNMRGVTANSRQANLK